MTELLKFAEEYNMETSTAKKKGLERQHKPSTTAECVQNDEPAEQLRTFKFMGYNINT
jgi:hypothetical protein